MGIDVQFSWHDAGDIPDAPVNQIYGYIINDNGAVLLIEDRGKYNLPGGKMEAGESYEQTLCREAMEEAQVTLKDIVYLGYQLVENDTEYWDGTPYLQLRYLARVNELLSQHADPATGRMYNRHFVPVNQVMTLLDWRHTGHLQVSSVKRQALSRWGLRLGSITERL